MAPIKVAVIFERFGPYHVARLNATNNIIQIYGIEFTTVDSKYKWDQVSDDSIHFEHITVVNKGDVVHDKRLTDKNAVARILSQVKPDVVAIPGWSEQYSLTALKWCSATQIPAIVMSESSQHDQPRNWLKEFIKKQVIKNYSAGLVGGRAHVEYLKFLGLAEDSIFTGYDVIDNDYFSRGVQATLSESVALRKKYDLPEKYFLSSNRFIAKKNLSRLLEAYSLYIKKSGDNGWKLVILGDGELRSDLEKIVSDLCLQDKVFLPGFMQYPDLPFYYGLANTYVHASTTEQWGLVVNEAMAAGLPVLVSERCGCAPDLVDDGKNGYTFDPYDVERLAELMLKMSNSKNELDVMGQASKDIISNCTPATFAEGLMKAAKKALDSPCPKNSVLNRAFLQMLAHR